MRLKLAFALVILFGWLAPAYAQQAIKVGTEGAYPPFNYYTPDGELAGFDIDITKELCRRINAECSFVSYEWPALVPALLSNQIDAISASMSITQRRKEIVSFTDKYFQAGVRFATCRSGRFDFSNAGLEGKAIGVQTGTTSSNFIARSFPSARLRSYQRVEQAQLDAMSRRLDLVMDSVIVLDRWLSEKGRGCRLVGPTYTDPDFFGSGTGIAVRQEDQQLRAALNGALRNVIVDGTYEKISLRYFPMIMY